jgi:hypothetical protein
VQTAALGRADNAIQRPELGPDPVFDKDTIADCAIKVFPTSEETWLNKAQRGPSTALSICTVSAVLCNQFTARHMVVGTCALGTTGQFGLTNWGYGFRSEGDRNFNHVNGGSMGVNTKVRVYWQGQFAAGAEKARMLSIDNTVAVGSLTVSVHSATRLNAIVP